jgi:hypothetical protein
MREESESFSCLRQIRSSQGRSISDSSSPASPRDSYVCFHHPSTISLPPLAPFVQRPREADSDPSRVVSGKSRRPFQSDHRCSHRVRVAKWEHLKYDLPCESGVDSFSRTPGSLREFIVAPAYGHEAPMGDSSRNLATKGT